MEKIIIFKSQTDKFFDRFWKAFSPYLFFYSFLLFLPFFNIHGNKGIMGLWWILVLSIIAVMFFSARKWTIRIATLVTFKADKFEIEIAEKDVPKKIIIYKDNIKTNLKWKGGRPRILVMTVFDKETKVLELCSNGRKGSEYLLEEIDFGIQKKIKAIA